MFLKHIGKHNNRKVVVVYRKVPGEDHMALVTYTDNLPSNFHDSIMENLESPAGQAAEELADILFRNLLPDGRSILQAMHAEGFIKKVQTNQVILTPTAKSSARLDEINQILDDMATGKDAAKKMKDLDDNAGLVDPTAVKNADVVVADPMSDSSIAHDLLTQSQKMAAEAEGLLAESRRLEAEAYALDPALKPKRATTKKAAPKKRVAVKAKA
jgi:hypothetical protein